MSELFWIISDKAKIALCNLQWELYGTKLDMALQTPPHLQTPPTPAIPVSTDMDEEELQRFISQVPRKWRKKLNEEPTD